MPVISIADKELAPIGFERLLQAGAAHEVVPVHIMIED
jgi:hypothetical protein